MKHTKDGKNLNALLRRAMLGVLDIILFAMANCSICYLTMSGHIMATDYKYMIFNYLHFGLTSVLLVGINSAFGLYRSVWYFAGSDEIVKSFLGALTMPYSCSYVTAFCLPSCCTPRATCPTMPIFSFLF